MVGGWFDMIRISHEIMSRTHSEMDLKKIWDLK